MISDEELETITDLHQDIIAAIGNDLETGSHHWNNLASEEFAKKYPQLLIAIKAMGNWINKQEELR